VIGADRDLMVPFWKSEELAELIPDAKLTTLRSGHAVNVEAAEAFNAAVLDFIAERSPAPA
jgi:pimeloyl-ACP methyl ester carboxylesterase